jgi:hypothetical protein
MLGLYFSNKYEMAYILEKYYEVRTNNYAWIILLVAIL